MGISFINNLAVRGLNVCVNKGVGIDVSDSHPRYWGIRRDKSFFDSKPADCAQHVAAIRRSINPSLIDNDLYK